MTVQEVMDLGIASELQQLAIKEDTTAVLGFINLGMIELYKRFPLKVEEHVITLVDGVSIYTMPSDFMWLVAAYGEVSENSDTNAVNILNINTEDDPLSVNMISWNQVQVPTSVDGAYISLIYVAAPPLYTVANLNDDIALPPQMLEALLHYIGYRGHAAVNGEINEENTTHYTRFEASCKRIESSGMFTSDDLDMKFRVSNRGFI